MRKLWVLLAVSAGPDRVDAGTDISGSTINIGPSPAPISKPPPR